jgi:16S rRNA (guanine966-N2)-methyltransferase
MRVIAGTSRGRPLRGPRGEGTRPTSDKVKGAIFSMAESLLVAVRLSAAAPTLPSDESETDGESLTEAWDGLRVLDLYAGTGALGIEALSRGAAAVDFVDASAECQRLIGDNLRLTGLAERGRVTRGTALQVLSRATQLGLRQPYDVVFADPPYGDPSLDPTLEELAKGSHLEPDALVIVEHSRRLSPADAVGQLALVKRRRHGDTEVSIYLNRAQTPEPSPSN